MLPQSCYLYLRPDTLLECQDGGRGSIFEVTTPLPRPTKKTRDLVKFQTNVQTELAKLVFKFILLDQMLQFLIPYGKAGNTPENAPIVSHVFEQVVLNAMNL